MGAQVLISETWYKGAPTSWLLTPREFGLVLSGQTSYGVIPQLRASSLKRERPLVYLICLPYTRAREVFLNSAQPSRGGSQRNRRPCARR